jgi:hypothetical protein
VRNNPLKKKMWWQTGRLVGRLLLIAVLSGPSVVLGHETLPAPRAFLLVISGK